VAEFDELGNGGGDRLTGGRIAERWAIRDDLAMLLRLGALRPGPAM
jgi:hypothetical protein